MRKKEGKRSGRQTFSKGSKEGVEVIVVNSVHGYSGGSKFCRGAGDNANSSRGPVCNVHLQRRRRAETDFNMAERTSAY